MSEKHTYGAAYVMQMSIFIVIQGMVKKKKNSKIFVMNLCAHIMVHGKQFWLAVRYIWRGSGG